jgi:OmcA/MtrC family decaheme c-type cytochrome
MMSVRAKTPTREFVVGTGALPTEQRRAIADTSACLDCHVGSLYQHGGNRVDNVDMCIICHNPASSEQNVRVEMGVDATESYDGKVGQTYEFKTMLHAIHSAGSGLAPYVVYRTRGIYAWAKDESMLQNWPGASSTPIQVFGGDPAVAASQQPHNFHSPTYPRAANDCAACHVAGFDTIPDQNKAVATTLDAGSTTWANQVDDTLQGASAAACTSCHQSTDSKGHAYQNGWVPSTFEDGRQTILDTE